MRPAASTRVLQGAADRQVRGEHGGEAVALQRARVLQSEAQVDRLRRSETDAAAGGDGALAGVGDEAGDAEAVAGCLHQRVNAGDADALAEILELAAGEADRARCAGGGEGAGDRRVDGEVAARTSAGGGEYRVGQCEVDTAGGVQVERGGGVDRCIAGDGEVAAAGGQPGVDLGRAAGERSVDRDGGGRQAGG